MIQTRRIVVKNPSPELTRFIDAKINIKQRIQDKIRNCEAIVK